MSTLPLAPQPPSTASCQPNPRMQSAMVLFALEQAIGAYVTENTPDLETLPAGVRQAVEQRAKNEPATTTVAHLVQSTYVSEIIDMALAVSQHAADHPYLKRLKELSESLRVFDIRNAVCHPNRPFPECL